MPGGDGVSRVKLRSNMCTSCSGASCHSPLVYSQLLVCEARRRVDTQPVVACLSYMGPLGDFVGLGAPPSLLPSFPPHPFSPAAALMPTICK